MPQLVSAFECFLAGPVRAAERLYILGDLFDAWVGDDDLDDPCHQRIVAALATAAAGREIILLPGNRDFLLGPDFAAAAGVLLADDPLRIDLYGRAVLLSHGDALCVADESYQAFRTHVRSPLWRRVFLQRPLDERKAIVARLREHSQREKGAKAMALMDVDPQAVRSWLESAGVDCLIHGHTHHPAQHEQETSAGIATRWVLPDWHLGQQGWLEAGAEGTLRLIGPSPLP